MPLLGPSNFLSNWFFVWVVQVVRNFSKKEPSDYDLHSVDSADFNVELLRKEWQEERKKSKPSILSAILRAFGFNYALVGLYKIVWGISLWFGAFYLLRSSVIFVRGSSQFDGQWLAIGFLLSSLVCSISIQQMLSSSARIGIRIRSALMCLVYEKSMVLFRIEGGAGEVVNLVSSDCQRIADGFSNFHYLWTAGLEVITILTLTFSEIGIYALPGLLVILVLLPIQMYFGRLRSHLGIETSQTTSKRVHLMSELLTAIKLVKFYSWEEPFEKRITEIRAKEARLFMRMMFINCFNFASCFASPVLCACFSLSVKYAFTGEVFDAVSGFTILSLYNTLRYPLLMLPLAVNSSSDMAIGLKRILKFLVLEEIETEKRYPMPEGGRSMVSVKGASFAWDKGVETFLSDLNLDVDHGKLVAVIGATGSGKSSLIAALMNQMITVGGQTKISGSIGYVPQEAWLLKGTVRENITFGKEFNAETYAQVVKVCALERDLQLMPEGDQTMVAERGANLSGGQRQRVSLARAVYNYADVIFLDDPLSAVDQHVGSHIFEQCIKSYLEPNTVIFITHQLQYLNQVDWVVIMKDGKFIQQGRYEDLMRGDILPNMIGHVSACVDEIADDPTNEPEEKVEAAPTFGQTLSVDQIRERNQFSLLHHIDRPSDGMILREIEKNSLSILSEKYYQTVHVDISKMIAANEITAHSFVEKKQATKPEDKVPTKSDSSNSNVNLTSEIAPSEDRKGPSALKIYFDSGKGSAVFTLIISLFALVHSIRVVSGKNTLAEPTVYIIVYVVMILLFATGVVLRGVALTYESARKARELHDAMFRHVVFSPMSFFDKTPLGRVLSAFARHQLTLDDTLPDAILQGLQYAPLTIGTFLLLVIVIPWSAIPSLFVIASAFLVAWLTFRGENNLKDLEAASRAPVFSHLSSTLDGLVSIRAYQCQGRFIKMCRDAVDGNFKYLYALMSVRSLVALYLDVLTSFLIYLIAVIVVLSKDRITPASAGLILSNALQLLVFLQWTIRMLGEARVRSVSIRQIDDYGKLPVEAAPIIPDSRPPKDWPSKGEIEYKNVVLRYTKLGVAVLKNVTIKVKSGEKIGIVGRTGSGKSTLLICLLRIVEAAEGKIEIDGLDAKSIGLRDLRSSIAIIPQEPILFVGTIRNNIDPFNLASDNDIWKALDAVHLGNTIRRMPLKLESLVVENGKNFSLGQRQLFCIVRAIVSKTKILVLDEATAAMDLQTDQLIQTAIKENFADCTVLTIAHRLDTIMESDKILLMDAGKVQEFAHPLMLLNDKKSSFYSLVSKTGSDTMMRLYQMAENQNQKKPYNPNDPDIVRGNEGRAKQLLDIQNEIKNRG